ncbi:MAG: LysM peptidoglycan-binding domain-containing protein [Rikenellaceae bacterium]|nr:LysM peptidoglycan-binding domain-containing protein [Rikenellaceae bacterium]
MKKLLITTLALAALMIGIDTVAQTPNVRRSESIVRIEGDSYYVHTVEAGQTLYSLAKAYDVSTAAIVHYNPLVAGGLKAGQVLKIPAVGVTQPKMSQRKINRLFDEHEVKQGETVYSISRMYAVPVATLLEDNASLDPTHLAIGQKVLIRKADKGDGNERQTMEQLNEYTEALNSVSNDYKYHLVTHGETLYSLSKLYGVTQEELIEWNSLTDGLKAGAMIRVGMAEQANIPTEQPDSTIQTPSEIEQPPVFENVEITTSENDRHATIALMLPLRADGAANASYLEFYQGFLLGMEDLKAEGLSFTIDLYNSARSEQVVSEIVNSEAFADANLIVGPVYDNELQVVLPYAVEKRIAVVSPLAATDSLHAPILFGMAPRESSKIEQMRAMFAENDNIVLVYDKSNDAELEAEVKSALSGKAYHTHTYSGGDMPSSLFKSESRNVYVVMARGELEVDKILAALSSTHNNLVSRSQLHSATVNVIGSSRWNRFNNIDRNLFFKMGVSYLTSYLAKRGDGVIDNFDSRYIDAYQSLPSMYSYRGYDAAVIFGRAVVSSMGVVGYIQSATHKPLQTSYQFTQTQPGDSFVNDQWSIVRYNNDYTISGE